MKIGKEVEGARQGMQTLFMQAKEATKLITCLRSPGSLRVKAERYLEEHLVGVQQIYISDHSGILTPTDHCLTELWGKVLLPITLEITHLKWSRELYHDHINFMFSVQNGPGNWNNTFWQLRDTDQIKFSNPKGAHHRVACFTKADMVMTDPDDFLGDVDLPPFKVSEG